MIEIDDEKLLRECCKALAGLSATGEWPKEGRPECIDIAIKKLRLEFHGISAFAVLERVVAAQAIKMVAKGQI